MDWEILANVPDNGLYDIHDDENVVAMNVGAEYINLISAAPEMYAALRNTLQALELVDGLHDASLNSALTRQAHRSLCVLKARAALRLAGQE